MNPPQIEAQRKRVQFGEGGARERADDVFFCRRHKKASEQSGLCSDVEGVDTLDAYRNVDA